LIQFLHLSPPFSTRLGKSEIPTSPLPNLPIWELGVVERWGISTLREIVGIKTTNIVVGLSINEIGSNLKKKEK